MKGFKVRIISVASSSLSDYCGEIEFSTKPPQSEEEEKGRKGEGVKPLLLHSLHGCIYMSYECFAVLE
jgi:hypothetical protein